MIRFFSLVMILIVAGMSLIMLPTATAQTAERCFDETGFCISGRIREYWEQNGGLPVFGLPVGPQQQLQSDGQSVEGQWFERHRLELHPENARPYDVLLGRLGADRLAQQSRDWFAFPKSEPQPECRYFPETGHNICGEILTAWRASGIELDGRRGKAEAESLALFGLPLSDAVQETIEGREYTVQWFERARFELHPENQAQGRVLLGLLGTEVNGIAPAPPRRARAGTVLNTSVGPLAISEITFSERFPPDCNPADPFCGRSPAGSIVLIIWLEPAGGQSPQEIGGKLLRASADATIITQGDTRSSRETAGLLSGRLLAAFVVPISSPQYILDWPGNPLLQLDM